MVHGIGGGKLQHTTRHSGLQWGVKGLELRAIPILEPWELFPGGDLRHFVVEGI